MQTLVMSLDSSIVDYVDKSLNSIPIQTTIGEAGQKMMRLGVDSLFVLANSEISGIISQNDLMRAIFKELDISGTVESIVSKPLVTIASTATVGQAIKIMKENNIRRLVVKDDSNIVGLLTQKKIFGNLSTKSFEIPELEMPEKIKCPYCSSSFQKKDELSKHIDQIHVGYGVFQGNFSRAEDLGSISSANNYPKSL